jgi:hypothetical protein
MTLLLGDAQFADRRTLAEGALRSLADSLAADLDPLLGHEPYIPAAKALLSRVGGRCESDGTDLEFNPQSPHAHRCPGCGRVHTGEYHDRWWLYPYQLWLAERSVHAAMLGALRDDERHRGHARAILLGYADRYLEYPNRDNVLGPSRLFFSTYLESLWLLHICIAADVLHAGGDVATADIVRDRIVQPAVELIETYDEGMSNRQAWNTAAIVAARTFLGERVSAPSVEFALTGIETLLHHAVGTDGNWYEGNNYHQFAHRGLWYGITLGERAGHVFDPELVARFDAGFRAPFVSALPDFTYPARKDSRYAASLRQWMFAESCELGLARHDDPVLTWALARMYADDIPPGDTGRARSSGEAERHSPPVRLTRADLGWRSLLFARASLPPPGDAYPGSVTVESQGLTIHRRQQGDVYVALDWGQGGGGHGHPDCLNLLFSHGATRWLDDLGTGSYVDPSLHWYRSTLAHNAPLVDGRSQARVHGECIGLGADAGFEFVSARAYGIAPGVRVERTVVTADRYFIDEVRWEAEDVVQFDLPVHFDAACDDVTFAPGALEGGSGLEDGFGSIGASERTALANGEMVRLSATRGHHGAQALLWVNQPGTLFRASAPGQPASEPRHFHLVRCRGTRGIIRTVWTWSAAALSADFGEEDVTVRMDGATDTHRITKTEWIIRCGTSEPMIVFTREPALPDVMPENPLTPAEEAAARGALTAPHEVRLHERTDRWFADLDPVEADDWTVFELGAEHYRQSEDNWHDANEPRARVAVGMHDEGIVVDIAVSTDAPVFVPAGAVNPFDNEHPDINGHGVQLYLATENDGGAWVLVPEADSNRVRARTLEGWGSLPAPIAEWRAVPDGFELRATVPASTGESGLFALDVLVNDATPGRTRRRGQLVLSGAEGEFVYLRGDRHDPSRLIPFSVD